MMIPIVASLLATLAQNGLGLLASAIKAKGKEVIEEKLGMPIEDNPSPEAIQELAKIQASNEQFLINAALDEQKLDLEVFKAEVEDRNSAREMNTAIATSDKAPWYQKALQPFLAVSIVYGGGLMVWYTDNADFRTTIVGVMMLVIGYYFGSSQGSHAKESTISKLVGKFKE